MKNIRWGIVGPGNIAKEFTKDLAFISDEHHFVSTIVGHKKESAQRFQEEFKTEHVFFKVADLIQNGSVDAVYIASPHPFHHEACLELLEAKIPVLCEKPLAINETQVKNMVEASKKQDVFLMEGLWTRFLPSFCKVLELIQANSIGEINSIEASMTYYAPFDPKSRFFDPKLGGGSLLDLGIYPVFLSYLLLGMPQNIQAFSRIGTTQVDLACTAILSYSNGAYASVESSLLKQSPLEATIFGEKGIIQLFPPWTEKPEQVRLSLYDGSVTDYKPEWKGKGLYFEIQEVMKCIENSKRESDVLSHQTSLDIIKILDEIRRQTNIKYPLYE